MITSKVCKYPTRQSILRWLNFSQPVDIDFTESALAPRQKNAAVISIASRAEDLGSKPTRIFYCSAVFA
jgi:hypothetical protein